jgi:hypothetical protein
MASRQIYASSSGDTWDLVRDDRRGSVLIRHQPNAASGGQATDAEIDVFLTRHRGKAESEALLQMIGTLVKDATRGLTSTEDPLVRRAGQLFEAETGRPWSDAFSKSAAATPPAGPGEDERAAYIDRARRELDAIEEEGHS